MISDKLFHVEGWFNLPDKFPGGCGQELKKKLKCGE